MSIKLTDTQLVLLGAASQRPDLYLTLPNGPWVGPARKAGARLLADGLVREVRARKDAPVWRRNEDAGQGFALKLTAAGLKAIAVESDGCAEPEGSPTSGDGSVEAGAPASQAAEPDALPEADHEETRAPRAGTKISDVIGILSQEAGATLDEIVSATGWLPHTARAALTGMRKRGYLIVTDRSDRGLGMVYRIAPARKNEETPAEVTGDAPTPQREPDTDQRMKPARSGQGRRRAA